MYKYMKKDINFDKKKERDKSTGIPIHIKHYIENQTGLSYDDVRIHYNSSKPSQFKALGYTQGKNVFLGQGQEKHLMHELCHVAQQKKGLVKPTSFIEKSALNDNAKLEKEAELCEEQYKSKMPIQMLRQAVAQGSKTMEKKGLSGNSLRYHTLACYELEGYEGDAVWSNHEHWMGKGEGDHAEDAICDLIEEYVAYKVQTESLSEGDVLKDKTLEIWLSSSPCERCQERLNELTTRYNLNLKVTCAKKYKGEKGGGAGDDDSRQYDQIIVTGSTSKDLLQF